MKEKILSAILLTLPNLALAATHPLEGDYQLDFFASAGDCVKEVFVESQASQVDTNIVQLRETSYPIGGYCHDRTTSGQPPVSVADCMTYVELNTLTNNNRTFESTWSAPVVTNGIGRRVVYSRLTLNLLSDDRLQSDYVGFDREGVVEQPIFRCVYDRVN